VILYSLSFQRCVCKCSLGSASAFHKVYEEPIIASRQPTATAAEKVMGEARANQVISSIVVALEISLF